MRSGQRPGRQSLAITRDLNGPHLMSAVVETQQEHSQAPLCVLGNSGRLETFTGGNVQTFVN